METAAAPWSELGPQILSKRAPWSLVGTQIRSNGPLEQPGPLNQEKMGLFEDHGALGARWGTGSTANCPLELAGPEEVQ